MIGSSTITSLIIAAIIGIVLPIGLVVVFTIKKKTKILPAFVGVGVFIVFSMILETFPEVILFSGTNALSKLILSNGLLFAFFAALLAALFEEAGRFIAFKYVLKNYPEKENSISYGLGHGGIEMVIVLGYTSISYLIAASLLNNDQIGQMFAGMDYSAAEISAYTSEMITSISSINPSFVTISAIERLIALLFHVSASVLVFTGVKNKDFRYVVYAFLLHLLMDFPVGLYQYDVIKSLILVEALVGVVAAFTAYLAIRTYRKL